MYNSYTLFQAEHVKTAREQREEDIRTGELAAEFGRLWHSAGASSAAGAPSGAGDRNAERDGRRVRSVHRAAHDLPLTDARDRSR